MEKVKRKKFFLSTKDEAQRFGGFCARSRELELFLERHFEITRKNVADEYNPDKRGVEIAQMINLAEALLICNKIKSISRE